MVRDKASGKVVCGPEFTHHIVLMGFYADSKARIKVANTLSQAAFLGCGYCRMNGVFIDAMRFAGYCQPVTCSHGILGPFGGQPAQAVQMGVDDDKMRMSSATWSARGKQMDHMHAAYEEDIKRPPQSRDPPEDRPHARPPHPEHWGCHRSCMISDMLWYVDPMLLFLVPFAHTYFRGVFKGFCDEICQHPESLSGEAATSETFRAAYNRSLQHKVTECNQVAVTCKAHLQAAQTAFQVNPTPANEKLMKDAAKASGAATREAVATEKLLHQALDAVAWPTPRVLRPELALTPAERREIDARSQHMTDTPDMGRPYTKFTQKKGQWTIEEWRRGQKPWLPLLFAGNLCAATGRPQVVAIHA